MNLRSYIHTHLDSKAPILAEEFNEEVKKAVKELQERIEKALPPLEYHQLMPGDRAMTEEEQEFHSKRHKIYLEYKTMILLNDILNAVLTMQGEDYFAVESILDHIIMRHFGMKAKHRALQAKKDEVV